ncbi:MAG: 50S ribosomal protein L30 [Gammaproteobacteria bacterium]|nr:50S ribosomal protein L30 [Gammaproteobacteria bacterium]
MSNKLSITLVKSIIGRRPKHVTILNLLGLRKMNRTVVKPDNACVRGMIHLVSYLVQVEELKS